jgi:hypothetical protein
MGEKKMKCELCQYQETPDNLPKMLTHLETCESPMRLEAKILWRNSEVTATLKPEEGEHIFDARVRDLPDPEEPPIVVHKSYEPDVQMMSLETIKRGGSQTQEPERYE